MKTEDHAENPGSSEQIKKYAQDLAEIYKSEKEKRKKLEAANAQLNQYAGALNSTINILKKTNVELENAYLDTIQRLSLAAEHKDENTGAHIVRTSRYCALIAQKLGLPDKEVNTILSASPMHDIGKVSIPDFILMKPGNLSADEFEIIKTHTTFGAKILSNSKSKVIQVAEKIAISHHEKWNGAGYPFGLAGTDIPLVGRIAGIVDVFDALISIRPYKVPYPLEIVLRLIKKDRGQHFDPDVVDVFMEHIEDIMHIRKEVESPEVLPLPEFVWSERDTSSPE